MGSISNKIIVLPNGGTAGGITGGGTNINPPWVTPLPRQVGGLAPLMICDSPDCRESQQLNCYEIPVFGNNNGNVFPDYTNDTNAFLLDISGVAPYTVQFVIQKQTNPWLPVRGPVSWNTVATISDNTYGIYQAAGSIPGHSTYMAFNVNWGKVLQAFGEGVYRIQVSTCLTKGSTDGQANFHFGSPWYHASGANIPCWVYISVTCGAKVYTVPPFFVNGNNAVDVAAIVAAINAISGPSFPFTAKVGPTMAPYGVPSIEIDGTLGAAQNGCVVAYKYTDWSNNKTGTGAIQWQAGSNGLLEGGTGGTTTTCGCALQSYPFYLRAWYCVNGDSKAHGTVRFEIVNSGLVGNPDTPTIIDDFRSLTWYDNIRLRGFFGYAGYKYDELMLEYGQGSNPPFGTQERVRDKASRGYKFKSYYVPKWVHDRLAVYMMMADQVWVSDYNVNNSDYAINRRQVVKAGAYEPEWLDAATFDKSMRSWNRRGKVQVDFLDAIQNLIKSNC